MANTEEAFPAADTEAELNPGQQNKNLVVDPNSSNIATSPNVTKGQTESTKKPKEKEKKEKKEGLETLRSTIIVSGIIVAVAGAIYAITKKLRDKSS